MISIASSSGRGMFPQWRLPGNLIPDRSGARSVIASRERQATNSMGDMVALSPACCVTVGRPGGVGGRTASFLLPQSLGCEGWVVTELG